MFIFLLASNGVEWKQACAIRRSRNVVVTIRLRPTTSPRYVRDAYFNYASCGWSGHRLLWRLRRRWYTRSSVAVLTTATSLLYGVSDGLVTKLLTIQNATARVVSDWDQEVL